MSSCLTEDTSAASVDPTQTEAFSHLWAEVLRGERALIAGNKPRAKRLRGFFTRLLRRAIETPANPVEAISLEIRVLAAYLTTPHAELEALKEDIEEVDLIIDRYAQRANAQLG